MKKYICDLCESEMEENRNLIRTAKKIIYPCNKCMSKVTQYLELSSFKEE